MQRRTHGYSLRHGALKRDAIAPPDRNKPYHFAIMRIGSLRVAPVNCADQADVVLGSIAHRRPSAPASNASGAAPTSQRLMP
jgi:hypothetical protein